MKDNVEDAGRNRGLCEIRRRKDRSVGSGRPGSVRLQNRSNGVGRCVWLVYHSPERGAWACISSGMA